MKRFAILLGVLIVGAILVLRGCGASDESNISLNDDNAKWEKYEVVASLNGKLQFRGTVEARHSIIIENPGNFSLLNALHGDGDYVSQDDVLLQWDDAQLKTQLAQKKEERGIIHKLLDAYIKVNIPRQRLQDVEKLHRIEEDIIKAKSALDLETHLLKKNKGDKQRVIQANKNLQQLRDMHQNLNKLIKENDGSGYSGQVGTYRLKLLELKNSIQELEMRLSKCITKAPIAGIVQALQPLKAGPMKSGAVLKIIDIKSLVVIGNVWQNEFLRLAPGQKAKVYPDFLNSDPLPGQIELKIPYGETIKEISTGEQMAQFKIMVKLLAHPENLLSGMTAMVIVESKHKGLQIPEDFVHSDAKGHYILKAGHNDKPVKTKVLPKPGYEGHYIVPGLKTGDVLLKARLKTL